MKRTSLILIAIAATFAFVPTPADAATKRTLASYCTPTGDYCQFVHRSGGRIQAEFRTFSFTGKYRLCVRSKSYGNQCRGFRFRRDKHGVYFGKVSLAKHFQLRKRGKYSVSWISQQGFRIGKKLKFRK